jgi:deoxyribodipyrimidine photo-lyase
MDDLPLCTDVSSSFSDAETRERRDPDMLRFQGGEHAALQRLEYYLWDSQLLSRYFTIRNGMLGGDYSSKLSPWLAHGCISPRQIWAECTQYEQTYGSNKSTYWLVFELLWRDFFRLFCMKHGNRVFMSTGAKGSSALWRSDPEAAERWKTGHTGVPLVDANMRELAATGFQSNRGRQNVASYLCLDLQLDWRIGADHFESFLIDHDVTSNYGNWNAAAGLTGGRINKFNLSKQSRDYDPQGNYIRTWLPELRDVPLNYLFEPWKMPQKVQQSARCVIGVDYPAPITLSTAKRVSGAGGEGRAKGADRGVRGKRQRGQGGKGGTRGSRQSQGRRSEFEMYG